MYYQWKRAMKRPKNPVYLVNQVIWRYKGHLLLHFGLKMINLNGDNGLMVWLSVNLRFDQIRRNENAIILWPLCMVIPLLIRELREIFYFWGRKWRVTQKSYNLTCGRQQIRVEPTLEQIKLDTRVVIIRDLPHCPSRTLKKFILQHKAQA